MSLDPTHSEALYRRSVKKFLVDNLYTVDNIYIDFSKMYMKPTDGVGADIDKWIRFHFQWTLDPWNDSYWKSGRIHFQSWRY